MINDAGDFMAVNITRCHPHLPLSSWYLELLKTDTTSKTIHNNGLNLPQLSLEEDFYLGIQAYDIYKHPNRLQLERETVKNGYFPPKLMQVEAFSNIVEQIYCRETLF